MKGDHDSLLFAVVSRQSHHHPGEDALVAPPLPTVVERLMGAVFLWRIPPAQPIAIDEDNPANTRLSSTRGLPCDFGKKGASLAICSSVSQ